MDSFLGKRKSEDCVPMLSEAEIVNAPREKLIAHCLALQQQINATEKMASKPKPNVEPKSIPAPVNFSPALSMELLEGAVEGLKAKIVKGIRKMLVWKPKCSYGASTFSFEGVAPSTEVFKLALGLNDTKFKMRKLGMNEFNEAVGRIVASIRYGQLGVTGDSVTVKWDESSRTFKINGKYTKC